MKEASGGLPDCVSKEQLWGDMEREYHVALHPSRDQQVSSGMILALQTKKEHTNASPGPWSPISRKYLNNLYQQFLQVLVSERLYIFKKNHWGHQKVFVDVGYIS